MTDSKEEIKKRLPITEVISGYVKLTKAGTNYKALCPFHNEKTPSFTVSPDKEMWYCFGCGEGGDVFSFVQKIEGMEFIDALRLLAEKAGVELKQQDREISSRRKRLLEINSLATRFFARQLESSTGKKVLAYLTNRGLTNESISSWQLGYAPDDWSSLSVFLESKGFLKEEVEATGLSIKSEKPVRGRTHHDRFRHRVMFPIKDANGYVIGFSGRLFEEVVSRTATHDAGKYINTPQTQLYDKSNILYGLDVAKTGLKKNDSCLLVEGNVDVVLAHQAGEANAVAPCGTAVGKGHFDLIKRYTPNVTFCFDADSAGVSATAKSAKIALSKGLNVSVITLPKGKDVADVISTDLALWKKHKEKPLSYIEFVFSSSKEKFPPTNAQGKKRYVLEVLPTIKSISSPVEQTHWLQELAQDVGMDEHILRSEMESLPEEDTLLEPPSVSTPALELEEPQAVEAYMAVLAFKNPAHVRKNYKGSELPSLFENEKIRGTLVKLLKGSEPQVLAEEDESLRSLLFASEVIDVIIDEASIPGEIDRMVIFLKKRHVSAKLKDIQQELQKAEKLGDSVKVDSLLKEFSSLSKELMQEEAQMQKQKMQI